MIKDIIDYQKRMQLTYQEMVEKTGIPFSTYYKLANGSTKNCKGVNATKLKIFYDKYIKTEKVIEEIFKSEPTKPVVTPKTEKVYIESIEDMIAELKNGSTVYVDGTNKTIKLVDGFIVRYDGFIQVSINGAILCSEKHYVIKEIPLKLEVGKKYVAKDGRVATVFAKTEAGRFVAVFEGDAKVRSYLSTGDDVGNDDDVLVKEY